jgi:hypothetical protein
VAAEILGELADCTLGKISMTIPTFVKLEHDDAARKAYVTVEDREVKKQREMWGNGILLIGIEQFTDLTKEPLARTYKTTS